MDTGQSQRRMQDSDIGNLRGNNFEDFSLQTGLLSAISELGWMHPSYIQEAVIPMALTEKNILVGSKSGTGKTGAYCIPLLGKIEPSTKLLQALIMVPTRELALQTVKVCKNLSKYLGIDTVEITAGTFLRYNLCVDFEQPQIIVATPGRMLDLITKSVVNISQCKVLVLDEADRLLSGDFKNEVDTIIAQLPEHVQTMLFSATYFENLTYFKDRYMKHPYEIILTEELALRGVTHFYAIVDESEKMACVLKLLSQLDINQSMIFCTTVQRVESLTKFLFERGYNCCFVHGRMDTTERDRTFHAFQKGFCRIIVCTDLLNRGIDVPNVNIVINYDFSPATETYLHRSGRAGRFGRAGIVINIISNENQYDLYRIQLKLGTEMKPMPTVIDPALYTMPYMYPVRSRASTYASRRMPGDGGNLERKFQFKMPHKKVRIRTTDVTNTNGNQFEDFMLKREILMGMFEKRWDNPSPVQEAAIPPALYGKDMLVTAKSGTGKTGAYCIPILDQIDSVKKCIQALVMAPTTELVLQISEVCIELAKYIDVQVMATTGIIPLQTEGLCVYQTAHIIIGTPECIQALINRKAANLSTCRVLVLDDADKLLELDFHRNVEKIILQSHENLQILLYSATISPDLEIFREQHLKHPHEITLKKELTLKGISQYYACLEDSQKLQYINELLSKLKINQSMIFCNSPERIYELAKRVTTELGNGCNYIHEKLLQTYRKRVFREFRNGTCRNLICSDMLARGIDVPAVNVVINFDFPTTAEAYLHRIGRCGRFGDVGVAISFIAARDKSNMDIIETELGIKINPIPPEIDAQLYASDIGPMVSTDTQYTNQYNEEVPNYVSIMEWRSETSLPPPENGYKTSDVTDIRGNKFEDFCLKNEILMRIYEKNWENPSPIQEAAIPIVLSGKDILVRAKSGTGKTGAFCIPILEQIETSVKSLQALIFVPTRELALQIAQECADLGKYLDIQIMPLIGDTYLENGFPGFWKNIQIITGTAGRIKDLMNRAIINTSNMKILVLDDVDSLFAKDNRGMWDYIMKKMPNDTQKLLLSAALTPNVMYFQDRHITKPYEIFPTEDLALKGVTQYYAFVHESQKVCCISRILSTFHIKQSLIFCSSAQRAELLAKTITERGYGCYYLHGKMAQGYRKRVFHDFRHGYCKNLTCTDLLANGIDIPAVNIVINFDFPTTGGAYLHRIGRCGRYGAQGIAISLVTKRNKHDLFDFVKELGVEIQPLRNKDEPLVYTTNTADACPQVTTESNILLASHSADNNDFKSELKILPENDRVETMAVTNTQGCEFQDFCLKDASPQVNTESNILLASHSADNNDLKSELKILPENDRVETMAVTDTQGCEFQDFCLKEELLMSILEMGWEHPSPVQERVIPLALSGKNIVAKAKAGTGKTGAYCIPVLGLIEPTQNHIQAIIVVASRELELQTTEVCTNLAKHLNITAKTIKGEGDFLQVEQDVQIVIATPGRISDLVKCHISDISNCKILVIDDADRLLSADFAEFLGEILSELPKNLQVLLFCGSFSANLTVFKERYLRVPYEIDTTLEDTLKGVTQYYAFLEEQQKVQCLKALMSKLETDQTIIFCNSNERVEILARTLTDLGYGCYYINSKMPQECRDRVFREFRDGVCKNLTSTDLLSGGIDIPNINVVINFDFPSLADTYLSRIGRTGRFGRVGLAINLITETNISELKMIEEELEIQLKPLPKVIDPTLYVPSTSNDENGGNGGVTSADKA